MENKKINILRLLSKGYIVGLGILFGIGSALAITVTNTDTSWLESDFGVGSKLTQNMMLARIMGYTCYNTSCSQKVYWKKFNTNSYSINDGSKFCMDNGMELPSGDQFSYYSAYNLMGIDSGTLVGFNSMSNPGSRHLTNRYRTFASCSTPGYSCGGYRIQIPNSRSSYTNAWGYSTYQLVCVYKAWQ